MGAGRVFDRSGFCRDERGGLHRIASGGYRNPRSPGPRRLSIRPRHARVRGNLLMAHPRREGVGKIGVVTMRQLIAPSAWLLLASCGSPLYLERGDGGDASIDVGSASE